MAMKPSLSAATTTTVPETPSFEIHPEVDPKHVSETLKFAKLMKIGALVPENCNTDGFFNSFLQNFIKVDQIQAGRISCTVIAKPPITVTSFPLFFSKKILYRLCVTSASARINDYLIIFLIFLIKYLFLIDRHYLIFISFRYIF